MVDQVRTRMSAEEFFELPESTHPIELLNGEVMVSPAPVPNHQRIVFRIAKYVKSLVPNGEVFLSPLDIYLDDDNVVQPDVIWVAENSKCIVGDKRLIGAPDLLIEVFSPGTMVKDKKTKYKLYERHGVREYWMVDPNEQYVEVYSLENDVYSQKGVFVIGETFVSAVLDGKMVDIKAVFEG